MRFITRIGRWAYVMTQRGQLYCIPLIADQLGYPIDLDIAADSCRRHAAEEQQAGNRKKGAQYRQASVAVQRLAEKLTAA